MARDAEPRTDGHEGAGDDTATDQRAWLVTTGTPDVIDLRDDAPGPVAVFDEVEDDPAPRRWRTFVGNVAVAVGVLLVGVAAWGLTHEGPLPAISTPPPTATTGVPVPSAPITSSTPTVPDASTTTTTTAAPSGTPTTRRTTTAPTTVPPATEPPTTEPPTTEPPTTEPPTTEPPTTAPPTTEPPTTAPTTALP